MTPKETVEAFFTAFNCGDLERAASFAAENIVYDNIGITKTAFDCIVPTINGTHDMVEFLTPLQNIEWTIHRQFSSGNLVINERRDKMTIGGAQIDIAVLGVFEVFDGKIIMWRDYCDMQSIAEQMPGG